MDPIKGKIIRGVGGFYYVATPDADVYECKAKGIFRKDDIKPLVGDDVVLSVLDKEAGLGNIDEILDRKNELTRPAVANVDQAIVVFSLKSPKPNRGLLDRFLLMMDMQGVPVWLCLTKTDLVGDDEVEQMAEAYEKCTLGVLPISNIDGSGIRAVRSAMKGKTTVLAGPSGVGKSSLVSHICPDINPEVGSVSKKTQRGKHTTRHSELYQMDDVTFLCDTPGFSALSVPEMLPEELAAYMPEFDEYLGQCRFQMCTHIHEPDCAVREAVGVTIDKARYESYKQMFEELNVIAVRAGRSKR